MARLVEHHERWSGLETSADNARVGILGIPFDRAVSWRPGAALAPERIRSITPHLGFYSEEGTKISPCLKDYGDVETDLNWERYFSSVENRANEVLSQHPLALFLGGDHSVGIPLFSAFAKRYDGPVGYIQMDSHTDLIDSFEGHRWSHACTARRNLEQANLGYHHLAFIGLRSYLSEEIELYQEHPEMGWHSARSVYLRGIDAVVQEVVAQMANCQAVYLSIDIDCLDPAFAPGTGTPEAGGLSTRECLEALRTLHKSLPISAMDIVEVSPPLDHSDITSLAALKIIYETLALRQSP